MQGDSKKLQFTGSGPPKFELKTLFSIKMRGTMEPILNNIHAVFDKRPNWFLVSAAIEGDEFQAGFGIGILKKIAHFLDTANRKNKISTINRKSLYLVENQYNLSYQYS